jgi:hypothetical protein
MTMTTEELREEIYTDLIQEFDHLTHEEITDMVDARLQIRHSLGTVGMVVNWMEDGNVEKIGEDTYVEHTTQWRKKFTMEELIRFYLKEFQVDAEETDLTELT